MSCCRFLVKHAVVPPPVVPLSFVAHPAAGLLNIFSLSAIATVILSPVAILPVASLPVFPLVVFADCWQFYHPAICPSAASRPSVPPQVVQPQVVVSLVASPVAGRPAAPVRCCHNSPANPLRSRAGRSPEATAGPLCARSRLIASWTVVSHHSINVGGMRRGGTLKCYHCEKLHSRRRH